MIIVLSKQVGEYSVTDIILVVGVNETLTSYTKIMIVQTR